MQASTSGEYAFDKRIIFTCNNKTLVQAIKGRLSIFANKLNLDVQILDDLLRITHAWGSRPETNKEQGFYSIACKHIFDEFNEKPIIKGEHKGEKCEFTINNLYHTFKKGLSINKCMDELLEDISKLEEWTGHKMEPFWEYIFIDEAQDFEQSFFDIAKRLARKAIFIAGDELQNIYEVSPIQVDDSFKKSYSKKCIPKQSQVPNVCKLYFI